MEGTTVGSYRIVRKLGEGGMGTVYVGEHVLLGREVAIKVLLPSLSAQNEIVARFFNEAKAVTRIADPGIVQVFDFGHHVDGSAFIVMELLHGEAMDRRLERIGSFAPLASLRLVRQICASLVAAHGKGIVHRDLKPENIFIVGDPAVTGGERAKILDFGIAKLTSQPAGVTKTRTGMLLGTPVYMSPEQCRGNGEIDARSDIYSIGCVMMTMLTGRPPFDGEASGDLIVAHLREPPPLAAMRLPGLPEMFDQILQRCLAKAPDDRFPSMASLVDTLDAAEQAMLRASSSTVMALTSPRRVATNPTTITHASGQALAPAVRRRLWPLVATVVFTTGAIVSAVMVRSHGHAAAIAALSTTTSVGLVPADAAVTVVPVDAAGVDAPEL
ncbi:MAG TPA: serine/threonine-protein kinase, partial [Kofleriaceae bacterium]|nr:serine/threonine-protein kinase [Kofleriaceae bacterium]